MKTNLLRTALLAATLFIMSPVRAWEPVFGGITIDKHNYVPYVWHKDIYIQNENIVASNREYHAKNVKVGNHVTEQKPQGNVTITNSNVTIIADKVVLDKGTRVNLGSTLRVKKPL